MSSQRSKQRSRPPELEPGPPPRRPASERSTSPLERRYLAVAGTKYAHALWRSPGARTERFATFENILYSLDGGLGVAAMRAFSAVPMHAACGAIMGYYVGQARFRPKGSGGAAGLWFKAYAFPVLIHGLYDTPLLCVELLSAAHEGTLPDDVAAGVLLGLLFAVVVLVVGVVWALRLVAKLRKQQLRLIAEGGFVVLEDQPTALRAGVLEPPQPGPKPSSLLGWCLIIAGFLIAGFGGFFFLGGLLVLATEAVPQHELSQFLIGCSILSLPPLAVGITLFVVGLKKLPKKQRRHSASPDQWGQSGAQNRSTHVPRR